MSKHLPVFDDTLEQAYFSLNMLAVANSITDDKESTSFSQVL